ncbi:MAG: LuxR C-terminal-related transcriptional regulator [Chloroflexota bacterium]|nr:LuxR C-terminal-related transcriptional regulator [Chloroflexota bacterium]
MDVPQPDVEVSRSHPLFVRSLNPMLIADDERRYVDANAAACLFLRQSREAICELRIDDLMPPKLRAGMDAMWADFLRGDYLGPDTSTPWDLQMPDGASVAVDLSSTPHFRPGHHLAIVMFPAAQGLNERLRQGRAPGSDVLTSREREILTLVALGNTGVQIAAQLFLSPATVQTHMVNTLIKLRARNRAHGIAIALQTGEIDLDDRPHEPVPFLDSRTPPPDPPR